MEKKKPKKILIFDASSIISLAMNGLDYLLPKLKEDFEGEFIIPQAVKKEIIDKPSKIKKFKLESLKMQELLGDTLELPSSIGISQKEIEKFKNKVFNEANHLYNAKGKDIEAVHQGEAECLALSLIAKGKNIMAVMVVDERTTRMIVEKPENMKKLYQKKLHTKVKMKKPKLLKNLLFIRSSELAYVAYKKGHINLKNNVLDALLYAVKNKGCAISTDEIKEIEKLEN